MSNEKLNLEITKTQAKLIKHLQMAENLQHYNNPNYKKHMREVKKLNEKLANLEAAKEYSDSF